MAQDKCNEKIVALIAELARSAIADALTEAGHETGISPVELAVKTGLSAEYITDMAWGRTNGLTTMDELYTLAEGLGCELVIEYEFKASGIPDQLDFPRQLPRTTLIVPEKGLTLADLEYSALMRKNVCMHVSFKKRAN